MLDIEDSVDVFVVNLYICHSNAYRSKSVVILERLFAVH